MPHSMSADRLSNTPLPLTPLVGRDSVVASVVGMLREPNVRLVTLTGPGGVGKTRIALEVLQHLSESYAGRAQFVPLAATSDPNLVISAIADALAIPKDGEQPLSDRVTAVLRLHPFVLVLDNFEQIVAAAPAIADLLGGCPDLKVLVTSRIVLRISGEHEYPVPPLTLPGGLADDRQIADSDAVQLFVQRARAVRPDFQLTSDNAPTIAAICHRLDGLPLAIELAAAQTRSLTLAALLTKLEHSLALLTSGPRNAPTRLQTMRNAIAWSFDLLTPQHQQLLQQLSVFVGGWTLAGAEAVIDPNLQTELAGGVLGGIAELIEHSLIQPYAQGHDEPRFRMLETIREYSREQLEAAGLLAEAQDRHAAWCAAFVKDSWFEGFGHRQHEVIQRALNEMPNLRAAMTWSFQQTDATYATRITAELGVVWLFQGPWSEGRVWTEQAIAKHALLDDATAIGLFAYYALNLSAAGDNERALPAAERGLAYAQRIGSDEFCGRAEVVLGTISVGLGDYDRGMALLMRGLDRFKDADQTGFRGTIENIIGSIAYDKGDIERAQFWFAESLRSHRGAGNVLGMAMPLRNLARLASDEGRLADAADAYTESLTMSWELAGQITSLGCLRGLARIASNAGQHEQAALFLAATSSRSDAIGSSLSHAARERFEHAIAQTRNDLGTEQFDAAWVRGGDLTFDQLVELGEALSRSLRVPATDAAPVELPAVVAVLTHRELEVLRLVGQGCSTTDIANQLFLSPRTVNTHITAIYSKLGFNTRVAAARFAIDHGLV